jgi:hypothetical protein
MSTPTNPAIKIYPIEALYRGKNDAVAVRSGNWFTTFEKDAIRNGNYIGKFRPSKSLRLVDLQDPLTKQYFTAYGNSIDSIYESYVLVQELFPATTEDAHTIYYVDMDGITAALKDIFRRHDIQADGVFIGRNARWPSSQNRGVAFHSEVMIFEPQQTLTEESVAQKPNCIIC